MNRDIVLVKHIALHTKRIIDKTTKQMLKDFLKNQDDIEIVCFNFLQIGELVKKLSFELCAKYTEIDWKGIKGVRDKLAHGYGEIDIAKIFQYCVEEIPLLSKVCKNVLKDLNKN